LSNKKKKEEEEEDLLGVDGSHMRMEWERKRIRGNKKRNRMVTENKGRSCRKSLWGREDGLVF
jgi:hypothetical protein